jgi:polygalacturonase
MASLRGLCLCWALATVPAGSSAAADELAGVVPTTVRRASSGDAATTATAVHRTTTNSGGEPPSWATPSVGFHAIHPPNSTCDKHTGQCCHHGCKMTNWPCCHHGRDCCCGGIVAMTGCKNDQNPPFRALPIPRPVRTLPPVPEQRSAPSRCCMFKNFTDCDASPGKACETVPCIENVTCPDEKYGLWCNSHEWHTSCAFNWTYGCSCTTAGGGGAMKNDDDELSAQLRRKHDPATPPAVKADHWDGPSAISAAVHESTRDIRAAAAAGCTCDVIADYHAVGDGVTDDTAALQKAFDDCGKAAGCSTRVVILPAERQFLSFPLVLSDALRIEIREGSTLLASTDLKQWPLRSEPMYGQMYQHFLSGRNLSAVSLAGGGTIDGQATNTTGSWWHNCTDSHGSGNPHCGKHHRPFLIHIFESSRVVISNLTLTNAMMYHVVLDHSRHIELDRLTILAPRGSPNTDGVDVHSTEWVHMHDCTVCNGDDAVAVATYDSTKRSGFVLVEDSTFCNGSHGASIGSRDLGGVHNVTVRRVHFDRTENAARVKAVAGSAGSVADILYENITAFDVGHVLMIDAVYKSSGTEPRSVPHASDSQANITRVTFRNVVGRGNTGAGYFKCQASSPCTDVELEAIDIATSVGQTEFVCESAYGRAVSTIPHSCLKPDDAFNVNVNL